MHSSTCVWMIFGNTPTIGGGRFCSCDGPAARGCERFGRRRAELSVFVLNTSALPVWVCRGMSLLCGFDGHCKNTCDARPTRTNPTRQFSNFSVESDPQVEHAESINGMTDADYMINGYAKNCEKD